MDDKIVINPEVLSQLYLPQKLLHREKEYSSLLNNLTNHINTFIIGKCGSGKTTLLRKALADFNSSRQGQAHYIDCSVFQTTYSVLKEIIPKSEFVLYRSNYELTKELLKQIRDRKFAVGLDSFENLQKKELIAKFMSLGLNVILASENEDSFFSLSENVRSNIPSMIKLADYSNGQTFDILKDRTDKALAKWGCSEVLIKKIAEKVKGNIALGISTLKVAAFNAENAKKRAIEEGDVPEIDLDCPEELSKDEKILLKVLQQWKTLSSSRLFTFYRENAKNPKGDRAFRNYMQSLCSKNLVKAMGDKRGRSYEIVESDESNQGISG